MKAIILAGGLGTRLGKYTENLPKCMLEFEGEPLIQRQVDAYRKGGIEDIIIIRKHLSEKIQIKGVRYIDETDYDTHMVVGLFEARKEFDDDIILSYGDIIFEQRILEKVKKSKSDVGIVADTAWKDYWNARLGDWRKDSESFVIGKNNKIISLGISDPEPKDMDARYVGMIKFSKNILTRIKEIYDYNAKNFWETPWHTSSSFKKAYMTDFMQELIDKKINVEAIKIQKGWLEFDTIEDYELSTEWLKEKNLDRFFDLKK